MELEILNDEYRLALESFNNTCDKVIDMLNTYAEVSKMGWFNESRYEDELFTESENLNSEINQMRQKIDKLQSEIENNAKGKTKIQFDKEKLDKAVESLKRNSTKIKSGAIVASLPVPIPGSTEATVTAVALVDVARTIANVAKNEDLAILKDANEYINKYYKDKKKFTDYNNQPEAKKKIKVLNLVKNEVNQALLLLSKINMALAKPILKIKKSSDIKKGKDIEKYNKIDNKMKDINGEIKDISLKEKEEKKQMVKNIKKKLTKSVKESYQDSIESISEFKY